MQVHPDEVEDDKEIMLIWDFDVDDVILSLTASQCSFKAKIPSELTSIASMRYLDPKNVNCNCASMSASHGKVLLSLCPTSAERATSSLQRLSLSDRNEEENSSEEETEQKEEQHDLQDADEEILSYVTDRVIDRRGNPELVAPESTASDVTETLFTESFTLKGSSYHEHFQNTLKNCKDKRIKKESLPVRLSFEPVNIRDENAILVHACPGNSWQPIGYIPGVKVVKVTQAINRNEITSMEITSIRFQYVFAINSFKYFATVSISKKEKWMKNRDLYKYNEAF